MTSETSDVSTTRTGLPAGRIWTIGLLTAVIVAVVNVVLLFVANAVVDPDITVESPEGPAQLLSPVFLASLSFAPVVAATALLWLLGSVVKLTYALRVVQATIVAMTLLNVFPPLGLDVPVSSKAFLQVAHLVVAVPAFVALTRAARPAAATTS